MTDEYNAPFRPVAPDLRTLHEEGEWLRRGALLAWIALVIILGVLAAIWQGRV